jgi:hypothetical protein
MRRIGARRENRHVTVEVDTSGAKGFRSVPDGINRRLNENCPVREQQTPPAFRGLCVLRVRSALTNAEIVGRGSGT